ncbi:MAG: ATP-dependent helicase [Spirochaetales bacterium]
MSKLNFATLNREQLEAVNNTQGAVLVTAGAGSGKTRVLTFRIANLIENLHISPYNILAVTFTNKAASEMKERLNSMLTDVSANNMWVMTFHSMCVRLLRENRNIERLQGYTVNFSIYDTDDRARILKGIIADAKIEDKDYLEKLEWNISNYKNKNISLDSYANEISYYKDVDLLIDLMQKYEQKMNANNALDFDSLLTYTYKLLAQYEDVREYYQNKFKYIHIDEFQDTNKVQYDLMQILAGKYKNIFVVGDEDQCIYTWRGANSTHIFKFTEDYENVKIIKLEQNYRSTKKILEVANKVIKHNTSRLEKQLWTDKEDGVKVEYSSPYNERYEADYVAETIYNLVHRNNYNYSDIAILMRLNALTRHFEEKLLEFNLPYRVFGGMKFYDRAEIKNVIAYLKLLVNPKDMASFNRVINFPKRGIGSAALLSLKDYMVAVNENNGPFETILNLTENSNLSTGALNKFLEFAKIMQNLIEKSSVLKLSEFVEYLIDFVNFAEAYNSGKEEDESRLYNLNEFIKSVKDYEEENIDATLSEYLQSISLFTDIDTYDEENNSITLATVHGVKGLEFKVVFIVGVEDGIFPIKRRDSSDDDLEEERRLMYVAITRAKERLYITNCQSRFLYGETSFMLPSQFLKEAGLIADTKKERDYYEDNYYDPIYNPVKTVISSLNEIVVENKKPTTVSKDIVNTLKVNDRVRHPKFGIGFVLSLSGEGSTRTAKIDFETFGTKILALNFAPLEII